MVLWIIGLSGSGKTTLGRKIFSSIKKNHPNTVFIDGDEVRQVFGNDLGHTVADRRVNSQRIVGLCNFLSSQNIHTVCAVLSIFPECQQWNREHLKDYYEVFIEIPFEQLLQRDSKGLYQSALSGDIKNVVGVDIDFPIPANPDLIINNNASLDDFLRNGEKIVNLLPGLNRDPSLE